MGLYQLLMLLLIQSVKIQVSEEQVHIDVVKICRCLTSLFLHHVAIIPPSTSFVLFLHIVTLYT